MCTQKVDEFWNVHMGTNGWKYFLKYGQKKEFKTGEIIISAGELVKKLYFLESGTVSMKRTSKDGAEKIIMQIEENSLFGEAPFFTKRPIRSSFVTHSKCVVYSFKPEDVEYILEHYPKTNRELINSLSEKLSVLSNQSASLGLDKLNIRIVKFILLRIENCPLNDSQEVDFGSLCLKDIASILGVHRVTLYKSLKDLESKKLIKIINKKKVQVTDLKGLTKLAFE